MALEITELLGGALGGALVTSVLGPIVTQRHDRRDLRADVLRKLGEVETSRWTPGADWPEFKRSVISLRSAALVATVHRPLVEQYLLVATVARRESERAFERNPDPEFGGVVPAALGQLVIDTAAAVVEYAWHPHRQRLQIRRVMRALKQRQSDAETELKTRRERVTWEVMVP